PTLTMPGIWLSSRSSTSGSLMASPCTSRIQLPLSVSTPSRQTGCAPVAATIARATMLRAIGMTSTGSGNLPRTSTCLLGSMMQTNVSLASAMIFSRVSAAPPPLIRHLRGSHSSAPSTYSASRPALLRSTTSMPWPRRRALLCSELDTAPSIRCRMRARASMKYATVEPVPTPTSIPSSTNSMAFSAASLLASVMVFGVGSWNQGSARVGPGVVGPARAGNRPRNRRDCGSPCRFRMLFLAFQREQPLPLRRGHRHHRQARTLAGQGEILAQRIGMVADRLQRDRRVELAHEAHVDQEPARLFLRRLGIVVLGLLLELGWVRIGGAGDFGDPVDPRHLAVGVVEQDAVADAHVVAHGVARLVVANAGP